MAVEDRVESLVQRHAQLEEELQQELNRPLPDEVEIKRIKLAKLKIKDELAKLRSGSEAV